MSRSGLENAKETPKKCTENAQEMPRNDQKYTGRNAAIIIIIINSTSIRSLHKKKKAWNIWNPLKMM